MAQISVFDYCAGSSVLHTLDVRFKLAVLLFLNLAIGSSGGRGLAIVSTILVILLVYLRVPLRSLLLELRMFLLLLLFVLAARSFSEPGSPLISSWRSGITREGVMLGVMICWRLAQVVLLGVLFMRTSRPLEVKAALYRFLSWIPGFPAHRVSLMVSIMFRFIPMILELNAEISEAQQARVVGQRRNPLYRMKLQVVPLMQNIFRKADEMVLAMEARCYSDNRTDPEFSSKRKDWISLLGAVVLIMLMLLV